MKALIVANGDLPSPGTLLRIAAGADLVLATDGAAARTACDLPLSFICGDFDSIDYESAKLRYPESGIVELPSQDLSDLEKTLQFAIAKGATQFMIAGGLGGRMDHSLVSLALLMQFHRTVRISLIDDSHQLFFLSPGCHHGGEMRQPCVGGVTVSLVSFAPESRVSVSGVHWPLSQVELPPGSGGVSNLASGGLVSVTVHQGVAAVSFPLATDESR